MRILKCISALMTLFGSGSLRRFFCFVLGASFVFMSSASFAATEYYWIFPSTGQRGPTALSACPRDFTASQFEGTAQPSSVEFIGSDGSGAYCNYTGTLKAAYGGGSWTYMHAYNVGRMGDSCPQGKTYNSATGGCEAPNNKCEILKGTTIPSFKFKSTTDAPSGTISKNGCAVELGTGICVTRTAPLYDCTFSGTVTGEELAIQNGTSTSDCTGEQCHDGEPQKTTTDDPCSAIPSGSGFTCTSSKSEDNPGKSQCGTANGAYVCVDNPKPTSSQSATKVEQTSSNNSDGSTTTKTTSTTTTTVCKGIGNCATGTTTTVTTGGTNANGTSKPNSSTCSGPECGGGTVKPGNGNGTGDSGDGEGEEGDDEQDTVSGDMACDAVVACSGDVIQCAILRQEQQSRCADKDFRDLSDKKVADAKATLDSEFSQSDYKEIKPDGDHNFDVSNMLDTSSFLGASCPKLPAINGTYGSQAVNIDFNLSEFCTLLTVLGFINVAFALKRAASIIGEGAV